MSKKVRSREVMATEVMRDALTSVLENLQLAKSQLGVARTVSGELTRKTEGYSLTTMLIDREYELKNTAVWVASALDAIASGAIVPMGQSSPEVKGGGNGNTEPVGQGGADVRSRRGHRI